MSVPAASSSSLCGAWANPADVPVRWRETHTDEQWENWLWQASEVLYHLSGERWSGVGCTYTAELRGRPPAPGTGAWPYYRSWGLSASGPAYWWWSDAVQFAWHPAYRGMDPQPYAVKLPHDEVQTINSVTINTVAFTAYRLVRGSWLERTDGQAWQRFLDDTVVAYTYGTPPDRGGVNACVWLAHELGKFECGDTSCRLPKRVTSITRQGVSIAVIDSMKFFEIRKTGLYEVDQWLTAVNPAGRQRRARVWSPDIPRGI